MLCSWVPLNGQILSDFTASGLDGWSTYNEPAGGAPVSVTWSATGGNPGGYIKDQDISIGAWGWFGPSKFRGNLSAYFGCTLSFDLIQDSHLGIMTNYYDVMFFNNSGDTMVYNYTDPASINTWNSFFVPLTGGVGWKYGSSIAGAAPDATTAQITAILSDVKRMRIRAEYSGLTYETDGIDNVLISCAIILPVELIDFKAEVAGAKTSKLTWTTASENNCHGFQIEKSVDFTIFDSIGFIPGNGTTAAAHDYEFYDNNFNTSAYYFLKEVNYEGRKFNSDIVYLKNENSNITTTLIYPNPTTDIIIIAADDANPLLNYVITDYLGNSVARGDVGEYSGLYKESISMQQFPAGIYTVTFNKQYGTDVQRFSLIK